MIKLRENIFQYIDNKDWRQVKNLIVKLHASEAANILVELEDLEVFVFVFRLLPRSFGIKVFAYLSPTKQDNLLQYLTKLETSKLLEGMPPDDRVDLFEDLPYEVSNKLLKSLDKSSLEEVYVILRYPKNSVGRQMTTRYLAVTENMTVGEVFEQIRQEGMTKETVDIIYIVNEIGKLVNFFTLKKLVLSSLEMKVKDIKIHTDLISVNVHDDIELAIDLIKKWNLPAMPVVDNKNFLIGIVTIDDLMDLQDEEITEDFHKLAGISRHDDDNISLNYIYDATVRLLYKKRIYWLLLLVFVNIFSGSAIASFEDVLNESISLVFFLPLLIDSGGNAGAQSATLMIRAIATGNIQFKHWFSMFKKELSVAVLLGLTMGMAVSLLGFARGGFILALIVATSMGLIVLVGSLIGLSLPFVFLKLKKDPAVASGPLVTSISDIMGVMIYFSIAKYVLL